MRAIKHVQHIEMYLNVDPNLKNQAVFMTKENIPTYLIKKLTIFHCKRGPKRCYMCQEQRAEKFCLLKICPDEVTGRMIQVKVGNRNLLCKIEIIRIFDDSLEAEIFAQEKDIIIDLGKKTV